MIKTNNSRNMGINPSHKRFLTLPKILVPVSADSKGIRPLQSMKNKFIALMPTDHIKTNISRMINHSSHISPRVGKETGDFGDLTGKLEGYIGYKAPNKLEDQKKKLTYERVKIRNLIGNNPFRVKNYVQGEDLDNDLVPLKLLKEKEVKFNDDDEFIEHFLKEKRKA